MRRQIWPKHLIIKGEKFSRVEDAEKLQLPDVSDEDIIKKYTESPAKATDSEIEVRLKRLKDGDAENVNDEVKAKGLDKIVQFKTTSQSKIKDAVDAGKSNPEGNIMMKDLEIDQKCRDDFNTWYWNRVKLKEGKKFVSKSTGTCEGSINEPFTRSLPEKCYNNNCKFVGNSSESVSLGEKTFRRDTGIQVNVSDKDIIKQYDASDSDDEDVKREKTDALEGSVVKKSKKVRKIKDDSSDAEESLKCKMRKKVKEIEENCERYF